MRLSVIITMLIVLPAFGITQDNVPVNNTKVKRLTKEQWKAIYAKRKAAAARRYYNFYHKKHYSKFIRKTRRKAKKINRF